MTFLSSLLEQAVGWSSFPVRQGPLGGMGVISVINARLSGAITLEKISTRSNVLAKIMDGKPRQRGTVDHVLCGHLS